MEMNFEKKKVTAAIVIILLLLSIGRYLHGSREGQTNLETAELNILNSESENGTVEAEIADTEEEKSKGLMHRDSLCQNCGMLFVYEEDVTHGFWMKDTSIPLSIVFIDPDGTIIDIQQMEPNTLTSHSPGELYRYALEVNQGFYQERTIEIGDVVEIPGNDTPNRHHRLCRHAFDSDTERTQSQ